MAIVKSNATDNQKRFIFEKQDSLRVAVNALKQPLWTFDQLAVSEVGESLLSRDQELVRGVQVFSASGDLLFQSFLSSEDEQAMALSKLTSPFSIVASPIIYADQNIGHVKLLFSSDPLDRQNKELSKKILYLTLLAVFLLVLSLFFLINFYFTRPITGLVNIAQNIEKGEYVTSYQELPLEFGLISQAFQKAAKAILLRDQKLKSYADSLEEQVEQRTRQIDEQRMKLIQSSRMAAIGEMSAGIAHEINNPLSIISGKSQQLKRLLLENHGQEISLQHLDKIQSMTQRISKIIQSLRIFARDGTNDKRSTIKLQAFFEDLKDLCAARLSNGGIDLKIDDYDPELEVVVNEVQLSQVLINLINNAADAIRDTKMPWIHIEVDTLGDLAFISVTDSGSGIPKNVREKMMQPFFTTKEVGKGTGLGLSISLGIIKDHGGELFYDENCPNTRFVIKLPCVKVKKAVV